MDEAMDQTVRDIDEMITHEKMQAALEYHSEAWAEAVSEGIEPEIMVDAALSMAIRETVRTLGEEGAEALVQSLIKRIAFGEFSPKRTIQ